VAYPLLRMPLLAMGTVAVDMVRVLAVIYTSAGAHALVCASRISQEVAVSGMSLSGLTASVGAGIWPPIYGHSTCGSASEDYRTDDGQTLLVGAGSFERQ
jgi:hypothetical protein